MRRVFCVVILALSGVTSSAARADVGPPPSCPPGTYHAYRYGHRCVPNGSHMENGPNGEVIFVKDGEVLAPKPTVRIAPKPPAKPPDPNDPLSGSLDSAPSPPATSAAPPPPPPATPASTESTAPAISSAAIAAPPASSAAAPPQQSGCTYGVPNAPEERIGFVFFIGAALFAWSRRRSTQRQ